MQKRALARVNSARLRVRDVDVVFNLCASPMDCVEKSIQRDSTGRFCLHGRETMEFPLFSSPNADTDVSVTVRDNSGNHLADFGRRY